MADVKKTTTTVKDKPARKRTTAPPLDMSTLTIQEAPAPVRASRSNGNNPFIKPLEESWAQRTRKGTTEQGSGRKVTVPTANVGEVMNLIRYAGNQMGIGTAIVTTPVAGGKTEIVFCAKTRRQKKRTTESQ